MKIRHMLISGICAVGALAAAGSAGAAQVIYASSSLMAGQQSGGESFYLPGPGTLTVELTNVAWPEQLASLNAVVSSAAGLLGPEMSAGTQSFNTTGGEIFAQWFGTAQGPLDLGSYTVNIEFQPSGVTPVPLPTSIALLLSGLAFIGWQRRNRNDLGNQPQLTA